MFKCSIYSFYYLKNLSTNNCFLADMLIGKILIQTAANFSLRSSACRAEAVKIPISLLASSLKFCSRNFKVESCSKNSNQNKRNIVTTTLHNNLILLNYLLLVQTRHKSTKKNTIESGTTKEDNDGDSDDDAKDDALEADDFEAPAKFKVLKMQVASLRSDTVISHALSIARNRMDEMFLGSSLLLNGSKMKKKAEKMDEGDYIDVIFEKSENQVKVKRVKLLKVYPDKTTNDRFTIKVRVWKTPFLLESKTH